MENNEQPTLMPQRMQLGEHERNVYVITVEMGVTREQLKSTSFWSLVANKLRPYDRIEVRPDDGTFYAEYLVLACDRVWAKVFELSFHKLTTSDVSQTQAEFENGGLEAKFRGPHNKWSVIRKKDGAIIREQIQSKDEADLYMREHLKTIMA